jgi:hypothetical protein
MKVFAVDRERLTGETTCGGCNYENTTAFVIAESKADAEDIVKSGDGLCGDCLAELMIEQGWQISKTRSTTDNSYVYKMVA